VAFSPRLQNLRPASSTHHLRPADRSFHKPRVTPRQRLRLEALEDRQLLSAAPHDVLYIGNQVSFDNALPSTVKEFDAQTGEFLGTLVAPGSGGLDGPRGLILRNPSTLLVVNQNVNQSYPGDRAVSFSDWS
jgi:hypothetical protein